MKKHEDDDFIIIGLDTGREEESGAARPSKPEEYWLGDEKSAPAEPLPYKLPVEKDTEFEQEEDWFTVEGREKPEAPDSGKEKYRDENADGETEVTDGIDEADTSCDNGDEGDENGVDCAEGIGGDNGTDDTHATHAPKVRRKRRFFAGDSVLWVIIITLLIFSIFVTFSAQYYKVASPGKTLLWQFIFIGVGIAALWLVHIIKYQFYRRVAKAVWIAGLLLTIAGAAYGYMLYKTGARAKLEMRDLSLFGISFQPLELLKIGMVMLLAMQLAGRQKVIDRMRILPSFRPSVWKTDAQEQMGILTRQTLPILGPILITCLVTIKAVGNSTTLIIGLTCLIMLFIGRVRIRDMGKLLILAAVGGVFLFLIGSRSDTGASRMARFTPEMHIRHSKTITTSDADGNRIPLEIYAPPVKGYDKDGKPVTEPEQATAAKMAVASGEILGKGPGMSTLRSKLPEAEKDYAYALLIEEFGAVGGLLVMFLFLWLFFRTIHIFKKCGTAFPSLLILGLGVIITLQAMMHMLVNVGLFPVAGQQLPLISKGGSSLVFTLFALGMILGVSRQTAINTLDAPKDQSLFEK